MSYSLLLFNLIQAEICIEPFYASYQKQTLGVPAYWWIALFHRCSESKVLHRVQMFAWGSFYMLLCDCLLSLLKCQLSELSCILKSLLLLSLYFFLFVFLEEVGRRGGGGWGWSWTVLCWQHHMITCSYLCTVKRCFTLNFSVTASYVFTAVAGCSASLYHCVCCFVNTGFTFCLEYGMASCCSLLVSITP